MNELRNQFTVLIVDDDASVRDALSLLISLRGYRTAVFACAADLLKALEPDATGCVIVVPWWHFTQNFSSAVNLWVMYPWHFVHSICSMKTCFACSGESLIILVSGYFALLSQ